MTTGITEESTIPRKGFTCTCGKKHQYQAYVFAHWRDILVHTCDACGAKHEVIAGYAIPLKDEK